MILELLVWAVVAVGGTALVWKVKQASYLLGMQIRILGR